MMEEVNPHHFTAGPHQVDANLHQAESRDSQHENPQQSLNRERVVRGVCAQLISAKFTLVRRVTFPMQRRTGTCSVRLTI